jgi:hypothetical protein
VQKFIGMLTEADLAPVLLAGDRAEALERSFRTAASMHWGDSRFDGLDIFFFETEDPEVSLRCSLLMSVKTDEVLMHARSWDTIEAQQLGQILDSLADHFTLTAPEPPMMVMPGLSIGVIPSAGEGASRADALRGMLRHLRRTARMEARAGTPEPPKQEAQSA